jgi:hypothetical protein
MFATHTADIDFIAVYKDVIKSDRAFMEWAGERVRISQLHLKTHKKLVEPCSKSGRIFLRDHLKFLSVNVTAPSSMQMKPMTGISDQNHILYPPFTDIQFNFRRLVNKRILKIKEHWTINIVDYIPEIIRSLYGKINS